MMVFIKHHNMEKCDVLHLEANNFIQTSADASFAVHDDMRSHNGIAVALGKGAVHAESSKQKLNADSSTAAELIAADKVMKQVLWTLFFLQSQGHNVMTNLLEQDNASTMQLEKNGKFSSSKNTRHVNIRCFFVTNQIEKGHVAVECVPTDELIANYLSKPLQGMKFQEMRQILMNSLDHLRQVMRSRTVAPMKLKKLLHPEVDESQCAFPQQWNCLLYTSPSPRDGLLSRMPSSA